MKNRNNENAKIKIKNYLNKYCSPYHTEEEKEQLKELIFKQYLYNKETKSGISLNMLLNTLPYEWAEYEQELADLKTKTIETTK